MQKQRNKIIGTIIGALLGWILGWLTLELFLHLLQSEDRQLVSNGLVNRLFFQVRYMFISILVGILVYWGAWASKRWNFTWRVVVLAILAIAAQFSTLMVKKVQLLVLTAAGPEQMKVVISMSDIGAHWIPVASLIAVLFGSLLLLFQAKVQSKES